MIPPKNINIRDIILKPIPNKDTIEILYIPDQTQILYEGKQYRFIIASGKVKIDGDILAGPADEVLP